MKTVKASLMNNQTIFVLIRPGVTNLFAIAGHFVSYR